MLTMNTCVLVCFSVSEVIDNAERDSLYKMKVFVFANLLFSIRLIILCKYSHTEVAWLKRIVQGRLAFLQTLTVKHLYLNRVH